MKHFIGIDIGSEVCSVAVLNKDGGVKLNTRIATSEKNLRALVKSVQGPCQVIFEECGQAAWLYSALEPHCDDVYVCNPKKNRDLSGHSKDDDSDAYNLAERARLGGLSRVWHGGRNLQALRERLREYQALTSQSTAVKNKIRAVFRNRGVAVGTRAYTPKKREEVVQELRQEALRSRVVRLGTVLDVVSEQRAASVKELIATAKKSEMFKSLMSMPGVGDIFASTLIAEVGTPHRFRTRKQFWSYVGLAVTTYESGQYASDEFGRVRKKDRKTRTRGLVKQFNRPLKCVFKQVSITLSNGEWSDEFVRLQKSGVSVSNARLTLARKAAAIALKLMKTGGEYDKALVFACK